MLWCRACGFETLRFETLRFERLHGMVEKLGVEARWIGEWQALSPSRMPLPRETEWNGGLQAEAQAVVQERDAQV